MSIYDQNNHIHLLECRGLYLCKDDMIVLLNMLSAYCPMFVKSLMTFKSAHDKWIEVSLKYKRL